eukprot:scaffold27359_cov53-Phaeocystis_antarctica.AAC.5
MAPLLPGIAKTRAKGYKALGLRLGLRLGLKGASYYCRRRRRGGAACLLGSGAPRLTCARPPAKASRQLISPALPPGIHPCTTPAATSPERAATLAARARVPGHKRKLRESGRAGRGQRRVCVGPAGNGSGGGEEAADRGGGRCSGRGRKGWSGSGSRFPLQPLHPTLLLVVRL